MNVNKLKAVRAELGFNQKEFAEALGIPFGTYVRKELNGSFSFEEATKIVDLATNKGVVVKLEELRA